MSNIYVYGGLHGECKFSQNSVNMAIINQC